MTDTPTPADLLAPYIRAVPDFPLPGILFRDLTPLLAQPAAFAAALDWLASHCADADAVCGIEARGFILGAPLAQRLQLPFIPIRKAGKLPAATFSQTYDLEYGTDTVEIHADALQPGQRAVLVDDLLATGGTARAAADLILHTGAQLTALLCLIELPDLHGRDQLHPLPVHTLLSY